VPRSFVWLSLLMLMLCGWASGQAGVWIDVPFIEQQRQGCGAAVIAMVMQYWEHQTGQYPLRTADSEQILRTLHSDRGGGIYASDMVGYFQRNGFRAFTFAGQWQDLHDHLAKGRPLITAVKPGGSLPLHYVVVVGIDPDHQIVLLNDPAQRKLLKEDSVRFEKEWKDAGYWTLLAVPESGAH
jgi:ABC-type bacteriocin/lantibiotic exporter with double-glycine peptidase domain